MRYVVILVICLSFSQVAIAADKTSKSKKQKEITIVSKLPTQPSETPITTKIEKPIPEPWKPVAFDDRVERLSEGYKGLNPIEFHKMFKEKTSGLKKGEYETTEEYNKRTANKNNLLAPISTNELYAFQIRGITFQYNADTQIYNVIWYSAQESDKNSVTCFVETIYRKEDSYIGSNAFGATLNINKTEGLKFSLSLSKKSSFVKEMFDPPAGILGQKYRGNFTIPLDKARQLKDKTVGVLYVGNVTDVKLIKGKGIYSEPTYDHPTKIEIEEDAVPFDVKKIVYYVVQTGEILYQKSF
ncbi:MAG: hypothetical protein EHM79_09935 [Geobacter sp.]|nr:MAG: hypothetical protein EHM79_09935 [Geobacter sp.]